MHTSHRINQISNVLPFGWYAKNRL